MKLGDKLSPFFVWFGTIIVLYYSETIKLKAK